MYVCVMQLQKQQQPRVDRWAEDSFRETISPASQYVKESYLHFCSFDVSSRFAAWPLASSHSVHL